MSAQENQGKLPFPQSVLIFVTLKLLEKKKKKQRLHIQLVGW
jgi:hypothetical protein